MIYKNMGEALQANAFQDFEFCYGVEAYAYHPKVWDDIRGWVTTPSLVVCSKQQLNVAGYLGDNAHFNNGILVIERDDYTITLSPKGRVMYSIQAMDDYQMDEWVNLIQPYFKELFEKFG